MIEIKKVISKEDLEAFIKLPWTIYKNDPNWVAPLISEVRLMLNPKENPFWEHADQALFLALQDGKVVGRIAGILDRRHNEFHSEETGMFGFFESINNKQVANALFDAVKTWLQGKEMKALRGPLNPSQNEECGLLVKGFDTPPVLMMTYNPHYYIDLMEGYGFKKARDLYAYTAEITPNLPEVVATAAKYAAEKHPEAVVRKADFRRFEQEKEHIKEIYNSAWSDNWGFVPFTDKEFDSLVKRLKQIVDPEFALFVEIKGKPVGFILSVPDYNIALKKINGRLFPFGWLKLLYYSRGIKDLRLLIMGVLKEYRMSGFEAMLYAEGNKNANKKGFKKIEFSWILEDNMFTRLAAEKYSGKIYKTYRIYQIAI